MSARLFKDGIKVRDGKYPDLEMRAIDLPDGYEWKLFLESDKPTITDIEKLERSEVDNDNSHPDYPHLKVIDIVYTKVKRSDDDIISMINSYENNANEQLIGHTDRLKSMYLYMSIVNRKLDGLTISTKMQKVLDKGDEKAIKIWKNDTKLKSKLKDLSDGKNPNVKTGWTNE